MNGRLALLLRKLAPISLRVLAGWLVAIALLSAAAHFLPVGPGYIPDHME